MEKKLLLAKSIIQTCFFGLKEKRNLAAVVGCLSLLSLFDFLFFHNQFILYSPGLNIVIMSIITLATAIALHQPSFTNKLFWWAAFGVVFSSVNVWYNPDTWSLSMFFASYFLCVGSIQKKFQNIIMASIQWLIIQICSPFYTIVFLLNHKNWKSDGHRSFWKLVKVLFIPLVAVIGFGLIYGQASQQFYDFFIAPIQGFFTMDYMPYDKVFTWFIGAAFIVPMLIPILSENLFLEEFENKKNIIRDRRKIRILFKNLDLTNELKLGTFTMIGLNILVFLFNILDLVYVWFGATAKSAAELSQYVHQGTNMTILSIVIGSILLIVFFRDNLNFHPKNQLLKILSFVWLGQNAFLASSTFVRNLHYVNEYGLTFKRLGVMFFIAMVLIGLFLTFKKINEKQTVQHLINQLLLFLFVGLLLFSILDHRSLIINHAVYLQKDKVDLHYLTNLSHNHDFLLWKHKEVLEDKANKNFIVHNRQSDNNNWRSSSILLKKNNNIMQNTMLAMPYMNTYKATDKAKDAVEAVEFKEFNNEIQETTPVITPVDEEIQVEKSVEEYLEESINNMN